MLVEIPGAEHLLPPQGVESRANFHIQRLAALHGVDIGAVSVHKKDEAGKTIESVEVRRDPLEPSFASVITPDFRLLAKVVPGGSSTLEYIPAGGQLLANSVEADIKIGESIP